MNNFSEDHNRLLHKIILESSRGVIVFSLNTEYCYTFFTPEHQKIMKNIWGVEIQIGMCMLDAISNVTDRARAKSNFDKSLSGEYLLLRETYGDDKLFRTDWESRYSPLYDSAKTIVGLSVFVTDLTEQVKIEAQMQEMAIKKAVVRERDLLLNSIGVGIYGVDKKNSCFFINPTALSMLKYEEKDLLNQDIDSIINHIGQDGIKYTASQASADQNSKSEGTGWFRKKNGEIFPVHIITAPLISQDKKAGVVVVFYDITEEYNVKQKLASLQRDLFTALQHN